MHKAYHITLAAEPVIQTAPAPTVSSRYSFVSTNDIVGALERRGWGFDGGTARACRRPERRPFAHHVLRFSNANLPALHDGTRPQAVVVNNHAGGGTFQLSLGAFRQACANGLVIQSVDCGTLRLRHVGLDIPRILEASDALLEQAPGVFARVSEWSRVTLSRDQQQELAGRARRLRWDLTTHDVDPSSLLEVRRPEDRGDDLWRVFNRVQEAVVRGGVRVTPRAVEPGAEPSRGRIAAPLRGPLQQLEVNRGLWALAEEVAFAG